MTENQIYGWRVLYTDKKGAGCIRYFTDTDKMNAFLKRLRLPANIENANTGAVVGELFWDDNANRWNWSYDHEK